MVSTREVPSASGWPGQVPAIAGPTLATSKKQTPAASRIDVPPDSQTLALFTPEQRVFRKLRISTLTAN
jgi:hypothetical protein